ncbi:MAG TPA: hypothetical protein VK563_13950 [Puia sp.]|nr:hypothetical protein [Puia sp.]
MFTLEFVFNPIILFVVGLLAAVVGYSVGRMKLAKSRSRIRQLETDMMSSHAEILELQKIYVKMENKLKELEMPDLQKDQSIPVIPMKISGSKDSSKEKASK